MTIIEARARVLDIARGELGYYEKASNSQLDDKTANKGSNNWNKYARDLDAIGYYNGKKNIGKPGEYCDIGYDWTYYKAFGFPLGRDMLYQPPKSLGAGTGYSYRYYEEHGAIYKDPEPADQIFFCNKKGEICHTGMVEKVSANYVCTIEWNSNNMVRECKYALTNKTIKGYGRPDWSLVADIPEPETPTASASEPAAHSTLSRGSSGPEVKTLQARLLALGYALPRYGVDGDFGAETEKAVRAYQRARGLDVDGIVGPLTWAALDEDGAAMIGRENLKDKPVNDGEATYMTYTVKAGDTLTKVAIAHQTTAQALAILNGIRNPSIIYVGQKIRVPV